MSDFRDFIGKKKNFYKSVVSVSCPLLKETVYFTSEGFHHLISKSYLKRRKRTEQYLKLKCLENAPEIVKDCSRVIEIRKGERFIHGKNKAITTYELVDDKKRNYHIAVVIERVGLGKLKFRSVKRISNNRYACKKAPFGA